MEDRQGKHSSVGLHPRPRSWGKWRETYANAPDLDTRIGLLYSGLQYSDDRDAAIVFYLGEAEGHCDISSDFFKNEDEEFRGHESRIHTLFGTFESIGKARKHLAKTAFSQLVTHFFKDTREKHSSQPSWLPWATEESVINALLKFFRLSENQRFLNLDGWEDDLPPHKAEIVREFLSNWAFFPWRRIPWEGRNVPSVEKMFYEKRAEFVDILCGLGQLGRLLGSPRDNVKVGEVELKRLEQLALSRELWMPAPYDTVGTPRRPLNTEEAAFAGSQPGQVAFLLRNRLTLQKHFDEVNAAIRERQAAERRLRELTKQ